MTDLKKRSNFVSNLPNRRSKKIKEKLTIISKSGKYDLEFQSPATAWVYFFLENVCSPGRKFTSNKQKLKLSINVKQ